MVKPCLFFFKLQSDLKIYFLSSPIETVSQTFVYNMADNVEETPCSSPASYTFVRVLGSGAFGEAVLYQKTEVIMFVKLFLFRNQQIQ